MLKKIGIALLILFAIAVFFVPAGRRVINLWYKDKAESTGQKFLVQDEIMSYRLKINDRIKQVQIALKKAEFYNGDIDGKLGPETDKAIKAFQKSKGLNQDGVIGFKTWEELNKLLKD